MANPIKKFGYAGKGAMAMKTLKEEVLDRVLLRRTKVQQADVLALPSRTVGELYCIVFVLCCVVLVCVCLVVLSTHASIILFLIELYTQQHIMCICFITHTQVSIHNSHSI